MKHIGMINNFYLELKDHLKNKTYVKTSPIREINSEKFYNCKKIIKNYDYAINSAKIVVCTYPMTTLSEAVMSNKPFVIFLSRRNLF